MLQLLAGVRQKGESNRAIQGCNDWLRMGPGRTLAELSRRYAESSENCPTKHLGTLKDWSARYLWPTRAEEYDARLEDEKNARAREIMETGLALVHERTQKLKELFALLEKQLLEEGEEGHLHNLWLPDVKQIGSGEYAERIDIERYNSPIISDIRGLLDDLAKETGGRTQKHDLTSDGKAITFKVVYEDDSK